MLLCYPKHHFCCIQDGFSSINISRCHWWVCWLGCKWRKPTPCLVISCKATGAMTDLCRLGLVLLSETVSTSGCIIFLSVLCQLDKYSLRSLLSLLTHCWGPRFAQFLGIRWRGVGFVFLLLILFSHLLDLHWGSWSSGACTVFKYSSYQVLGCEKVSSLLKNLTGPWVFLNRCSTNRSLVAEEATYRK